MQREGHVANCTVEVILRHVNAAMTVLLGSWDFIAIQRDVYFIVRVSIAVLIMFTYICAPSFILLACYIMFTMFNDDFVSNTPNISSPTNHRLRKREGERSPKHFNPLTPRSNL